MNIITDRNYLHQKCYEVRAEEDILPIVSQLFIELKERKAFGIAANQMGHKLQIFVMINTPQPPICIVNPKIIKKKGVQKTLESCLSIPECGKILVIRPAEIVIVGLNQFKNPVKYRFTGLKARIAYHEVDHLLGKLIIDGNEDKKK